MKELHRTAPDDDSDELERTSLSNLKSLIEEMHESLGIESLSVPGLKQHVFDGNAEPLTRKVEKKALEAVFIEEVWAHLSKWRAEHPQSLGIRLKGVFSPIPVADIFSQKQLPYTPVDAANVLQSRMRDLVNHVHGQWQKERLERVRDHLTVEKTGHDKLYLRLLELSFRESHSRFIEMGFLSASAIGSGFNAGLRFFGVQ